MSDVTEFKEEFRKPVNLLHLMEHFPDEKILTIEDEAELVRNVRSDFTRNIPAEEIRFKMTELQFIPNFVAFYEYVKPILNADAFFFLKVTLTNFMKEKLPSDTLFHDFSKVFGPILVYKYFFLFSGTVFNRFLLRRKLEDTMQEQLAKLNFKHKNCLTGIRTWEDYFERIKTLIIDEILWRMEKKEIDLKKKYLMHKERMFQLTGSVKKSTFQELIHWKYLNNFLENVECKLLLQRALLAPEDKSHHLLAKMSLTDLLMSFCYFDLLTQKMDAQTRNFEFTFSTNQNLLKRFMRTNPNFANKNEYNNVSDKEDYPDLIAEGVRTDELSTKFERPVRPFKDMINSHPDVSKKLDFQRFAALNVLKSTEAYKNDVTNQLKIEESFPALETENTGESIFDRMGSKKKSILKSGISKIKTHVNKTTAKSEQHVIVSKVNKSQHFAFKELENIYAQDQFETDNINFDRDFPSIETNESDFKRKVKFDSDVRFETGVMPTRYQSKKLTTINLENDFPTLENESENGSLLERMKNKKSTQMQQIKSNKKDSKKSKVIPKKPDLLVERNKRGSNKLQVDYDSYFDDRRNGDDVNQESEVIPEKETEFKKPRENLKEGDFPSLEGKKEVEIDIFEKMKWKKQNKIKDLKEKFGYLANSEMGSEETNKKTEITGFVNIKKKKK